MFIFFKKMRVVLFFLFFFIPQVSLAGTHPPSLFMSPNKPGGAHMWKPGRWGGGLNKSEQWRVANGKSV